MSDKQIGKHLRVLLASVLVVMLCLGALAIGLRGFWPISAFAPAHPRGTTVVIDAGHGGADGGAVSAEGRAEAALNLSIAQRLDALLAFYGVQTRQTREGEDSIHDASAKTLREKKASDIRNRVRMVEETPNALLISIHQNSYESPKYHGMQVFYRTPESRPLAQMVQENVRRFLEPENTRQAMKISPSVYLMKQVTCRAILVECGFLSNPTEALRLQEADYQKKIAITIAAAYLAEE